MDKKTEFNLEKKPEINKTEKIVEKIQEVKETGLTEEEKVIKEQIEKQIAQLKSSPKTENLAEKKWQKIKEADVEKKLVELMKIAKVKGISFANKVAQKSNDPYLIDLFHDILAKNGYYRNFPL
jgi:hypothetical protein